MNVICVVFGCISISSMLRRSNNVVLMLVVADTLSVSEDQAVLKSVSVWGALRGGTSCLCLFYSFA